ncbi:cation transporter [Rhodococcus sp. NPDC003348]
MAPTAADLRRERSVLRVSMAVTCTLAVLAVAWGIASNSQVILLDGAYAALGAALTWLSLAASRIVAGGPTARFPFGREALTPVVVVVQGLALLLTLGYAAMEAVRVIVDGGSEVAGGSLLVYGLIGTIAATATYLYVRRAATASDLLAAEATQWASSAVFSAVVAVGGVVVWVLGRTEYSSADRYVDSALVLISCAVLLPQPWTLIRGGMLELLESAPGPQIQEPIHRAVEQVRDKFDLPAPDIAIGKVGRKVYVEVVFLVSGTAWDLATEDEVRRQVARRLRELPYDLWATVELTTDPELV